MVYSKQSAIKILLFVFLFLQAIPLLTRENMQTIIVLDYSIVLPLIFIISIRRQGWGHPFKYYSMMGLIILSFFLYILGFSGSISGYILSAALPYFIFNRIYSHRQLIEVFYVPVKWASIILIIFGIILFYNLKDQLNNLSLLTQYFIKASINYVSLLFFGFSALYILFYEINKKILNDLPRVDFFIGLVLLGSSIFFSMMYLTRSTLIASLFLSILFLRQYRGLILLGAILIFFKYKDMLFDSLITLLGSDKIGELAVQDVRVESVKFLVSNAISFNYNFTDISSFSSLFNLLFCLFPFTLLFGIDISYSAVGVFKIKKIDTRFFYLLLLFVALFVCTYQMDFLSVFVLFVIIQVIFFEGRVKIDKEAALSART